MIREPYILVAEDDLDDRYLLKAAFEENGYHDELKFVDNGFELMDYLNSCLVDKEYPNLPQFILLDMNMPKKDGNEALKEIKQHPALKKIPIVIFSTTRNETEMKRCYDMGAIAYITKPNSFGDLLNTIVDIKSAAFIYSGF